jgi:universal stress protein
MLVVVPCDFTPVVDIAFLYVERLKQFHSVLDVHLLHVVEKLPASSGIEEQLGQIAARYTTEGVKVRPVVCKGSISDEIPGYAEEVHAELIIMGIHETKGVAKLFASKAVRVVIDSNIPFLVVQNPPRDTNPFGRILMPLGAQSVEKGKFEWAIRNAKRYGSHIYVLIEPCNDTLLASRRDGNLLTMTEVFDVNNISYTVIPAEKTENFKDHLIDFAKENDVDMLLIMLTQVLKPMVNSTDQQLLSNSLGLPVLCINPSMIK